MKIIENFHGAFQVAGALSFSPVLRTWYNHWGATPAEVAQALPGDDLVPAPRLGYTRAITIRAAPERVWPWLAQMGQGRGGLYSYDGLENLAGCKIHSLDYLLPELQKPELGELIRLGPQGYPCFAVASVEPNRALVLVSADPKTGVPVTYAQRTGKGFSIATWQFILQPRDVQSTRLVVRQRLDYSPELTWVWRLTEPVGFVMERKMLLGIRQRAESNP